MAQTSAIAASPTKAEKKRDIFALVFDILSSVKLGVCVLLLSALFFALSTIFWQEPEVIVKHVPLVKHGFEAVLVFLSLNLLAVTLSRYPWNKLKIGMLVTHAGLITTFAGAFLTCRFGVDGTITLREGEKTDAYFTGRDMLAIKTIGPGGHNLVPMRNEPITGLIGMTKATERDIRIQLGDGTSIRIDQYYPKFRSEKAWVDKGAPQPGEHPNPAIEIRIRADGREKVDLLPAYRLAVLGEEYAVAYFPASDGELEAQVMAPRKECRQGTLVVSPAKGEPIQVDVQDKLSAAQPLPDGYTVTIEKYFANLVVGEGNKASDAGGRPVNPAIQIRVTDGKDFNKTEWLFPEKEAPPVLGRIGLDDKFQFSYDFRDRFTYVYYLKTDTAIDVVTSRPGGLPARSTPRPGEFVPVGDGLEFAALRTFAHAVEEDVARNDAENKNPAIHLIWKGGGQSVDAWIQFGETKPLVLNGTPLYFQYTQLQAELPFELELLDFRLRRYEGTNAPSSFESLVKWNGPGSPTAERVISMNNPLEVDHKTWGTWKVFQTSYDPNTEAISTFSVSYDPGRPIVYFGFIAVCSGVFFMFWVKPFLRKYMMQKAAP